ncbi:alpha/beta hydrolase [Chromohalobacter canadensis]|uniref:alpha/beta hydrolase n=1 Tax=Chromohalobacter canadensis TaxID=141389 RepID=UPI00240F5317|nr:alpha/beta hydrolase-fold protein [Chromohalobacter canadensis]
MMMPRFADTQTRIVRAMANETPYRISLWMPPGQPPEAGWPVIYVLDANALFATFVEAILRGSRRPDATGIGAAAVVGIAHEGDELFATERRYRDYTFGPSTLVPASQAGGGEAFLTFIVDQLAPGLREEFALDGARQVLFGHSLAGYFVLYALMARPGAFRTFAAISPSIWWDEAGLHERMAALRGHAARVFVAVGEWEGEAAPWQRLAPGYEQLMQRRRERRMIPRAQSMARALSGVLGEERVRFHNFPEEDHASVLMIAIQRTLRFALAP